MSRLTTLINQPRSVHLWVSVALIVFGFAMVAALGVQSFSSQHLIEHKFWVDLLKATSAEHAAQVRAGQGDALRGNNTSVPGISRENVEPATYPPI